MFATALALSLTLAPNAIQEATQLPVSPLDAVVSTIGTMEISLGDVRAEVNRIVPLTFFHGKLPDEQKRQVYLTALTTLTEKALIQQDAVRRAIPVTDDELRAQFRSVLEQAGAQFAEVSDEEFETMFESYRPKVLRRVLIDKNEARFETSLVAPTDEEVRQSYAERSETLYTPEMARFQSILFKVPPSATGPEGMAIRSLAVEVLTQLEDSADFATLAKEHSEDIFAGNGGDMGFVSKGSFQIGELDAAAFALADGETSELLISLYGFHILHRSETQERKRLSFQEAEAQLRVELALLGRETARAAWMAEMRGYFPVVEVITLDDEAIESGEEPGPEDH